MVKHETIIQTWIDTIREIVRDRYLITREEAMFNGDGPRPDCPYITVKIISGPEKITSFDPLVFNGKSGGGRNFNLVGQRTYTISIKAIDGCPTDILNEIATRMDDPDIYGKLKCDADISVYQISRVIDITALINTGYERRSSIDFLFYSSNNIETGVGLIEKANVKGELSSNNNNREVEIQINK